mgnify:CR=1 FL=1
MTLNNIPGLSIIGIFFFQAEDGIRDLVRSRGLGDVYKRQTAQRGPLSSHVARSLQNVIGLNDFAQRILGALVPVSYTHLTLPTIYSV